MEMSGSQIVYIAGVGGTVAAGAFAIIKKALDMVSAKFTTSGTVAGCPNDPRQAVAWDRLKSDTRTTRETVEGMDDRMKEGSLSCAWEGRDEVLGLSHSFKENTRILNTLNSNITALTTELRQGRQSNG